jgi:nicotinic acid mononucleotide adenylyltransferase
MKKIDPKTISHAQCIRELRREIGTRNRIYPNWIAQNKIDEEVAAQRIACLERTLAIIERVNQDQNGVQGKLL